MVRKIIILLITLFILTAFLKVPAAIADKNTQDKHVQIIVYYFHGDFRCPTCRNLEQYAKEAIEHNFKKELARGELVFKAVNVEQKENEHFISGYRLYSKSLVLSLMKDGREIKYKNLDKIWDYVRNREKYIQYVKRELEAFLKEMR
ncbi:MAG: nitrophenyl compound nitroreductase subunit ArsF family protein [Candidatus Omnitrophota bacterium]